MKWSMRTRRSLGWLFLPGSNAMAGAGAFGAGVSFGFVRLGCDELEGEEDFRERARRRPERRRSRSASLMSSRSRVVSKSRLASRGHTRVSGHS